METRSRSTVSAMRWASLPSQMTDPAVVHMRRGRSIFRGPHGVHDGQVQRLSQEQASGDEAGRVRRILYPRGLAVPLCNAFSTVYDCAVLDVSTGHVLRPGKFFARISLALRFLSPAACMRAWPSVGGGAAVH